MIQNKVEAAYARTDMFERRRRLMDDLAAYFSGNRLPAVADDGDRRST